VSAACATRTSASVGIFGQIVEVYVADQFVLNAERCLVDTPRLNLIGRMHGAKWYTKLSDRFEMERPTWGEWIK
jgi:flavin reductase (DIM6/NTAB) family NADH-FMN oxidoreductase RutF